MNDEPAKGDADPVVTEADSPPTVPLSTLKERISYAIAIGAKGKRYRRIVDDGEFLPAKSAGSGWHQPECSDFGDRDD